MDQCDYWLRLEYRVCSELDGLRHTAARPYWCDGFVPITYLLNGPNPCVLGHAWMAIGSRYQERWKFTLLLDHSLRSVEEVDWSALLPVEDVTRWLTVDPDHKQLVIEPSAAVPDAAASASEDQPGEMGRPGWLVF